MFFGTTYELLKNNQIRKIKTVNGSKPISLSDFRRLSARDFFLKERSCNFEKLLIVHFKKSLHPNWKTGFTFIGII